MYVCGPTVYDFLHIGNFRGAVFFNLVRNWLEKSGFAVTFVYNYTDIDDKIIKRAQDENTSSEAISKKFITEFEKDFSLLKLKKHEQNPKATEHIGDIIELIKKIIAAGKAYIVEGEVFYAVDAFNPYGKLSGKKLEELQVGLRVEINPKKKNPMDFVLWKASKPKEPSWESPWGKGRPGWHIECSAMINCLLGESIDIHGGGIDLIFPHHENEIAQGEGASAKQYCRYWMHNQFVNLKDQKMSKSLGNVITARAFMEKYHPEILKFIMISSHYRSILNIDQQKIDHAITGLARVYKALEIAYGYEESKGNIKETFDKYDEIIAKALNDDFNTGEMMASIYEVVRIFNALSTKEKKQTAQSFKQWILGWGKLSSLFQEHPRTFLNQLDEMLINIKGLDKNKIEKLVEQRKEARKAKDWEKSDLIRQQLKDMGVEVHDHLSQSSWEIAK